MFGTYRTLLAFAVVAMHLGGLKMAGNFAVFGFYLLSGYLMTYIMHRNYGYTASGLRYYALNRGLRIYPAYWVALTFSVLLVVGFGQDMSLKYHDAIYLPTNLKETLQNLFLVLAHDDKPRLTPPVWALTVELFFYILIGLGLSRTRLLSCLWLGASILYHVVGVYQGLSFGDRYFPVYAASLPFSAGAVIYHFRESLRSYMKTGNGKLDEWIPLLAGLAMVANYLLGWYASALYGWAFYSNIFFAAIMVIILSNQSLLPSITRSFDKWVGDLSYPIYLTHLQAGFIVFAVMDLMGVHHGRMNWIIMVCGSVLVLLFSWVIAVMVGEPIERLRGFVKNLLPKVRRVET